MSGIDQIRIAAASPDREILAMMTYRFGNKLLHGEIGNSSWA
jgi:hypothetical protein